MVSGADLIEIWPRGDSEPDPASVAQDETKWRQRFLPEDSDACHISIQSLTKYEPPQEGCDTLACPSGIALGHGILWRRSDLSRLMETQYPGHLVWPARSPGVTTMEQVLITLGEMAFAGPAWTGGACCRHS